MKKLTALLLALVMLLGLCACGAPKDISIQYDDEEAKKLEFDLSEDYDEDELTLTAVLEPKSAKGEIEWESSDKDVVKVKDNGDGTCTLKLKGEGDAKVTASCGDLSAKVKISVEGDETDTEVIYAEEAAPAVEEAVEEAAEAEPAEFPVPVFYEAESIDFTINGSENSSGLPFTPNDILASDLLTKLENSNGASVIKELDEEITGGANGAYFDFECGEAGCIIEDYMFTTFTTLVDGNSVVYSLEYDGNSITGLEVNFGDGNITYLDFYVDQDTGYVNSHGYGGEQQSTSYYEEVSVNSSNGGFKAYYNGYSITLWLGMIGEYESILSLYISQYEGETGGHLHYISVNCGNGVGYDISANGDNGNLSNVSTSVTFSNGIFDGQYYITYYAEDKMMIFDYYSDKIGMWAQFLDNGFLSASASYYNSDDYEEISIDAYGNEI